MDILKKSMIPLTDDAWEEITSQAGKIFNQFQTARKFVDIDGPNGFDFSAVSLGRLFVPDNQDKKGVNFGIRQVLPVIETRKPFHLNIWELDNVNRGAKDINLDEMEKAARQMALFEEMAVYYGSEDAGIKGLANSSEHSPVKLHENPDSFLETIAAQIVTLKKEAVEGPYTLVIPENIWLNLVKISQGYPLKKQVQDIIGGKIITNHIIDDAFLVSERGEDYELSMGIDLSIGYDGHDNEHVKLYFTESFTFRVLSPEAVIVLKTG